MPLFSLNLAGFIFYWSAFFSILLLFLALGRYGDIKLGSDEEEPEFKLGSWMLLFTSGIGIGIVFPYVAEPLSLDFFHQ